VEGRYPKFRFLRSGQFPPSLRTEITAPVASQSPGGLPVLTSHSALRQSITTSRWVSSSQRSLKVCSASGRPLRAAPASSKVDLAPLPNFEQGKATQTLVTDNPENFDNLGRMVSFEDLPGSCRQSSPQLILRLTATGKDIAVTEVIDNRNIRMDRIATQSRTGVSARAPTRRSTPIAPSTPAGPPPSVSRPPSGAGSPAQSTDQGGTGGPRSEQPCRNPG
jgi:hypothetical protein